MEHYELVIALLSSINIMGVLDADNRDKGLRCTSRLATPLSLIFQLLLNFRILGHYSGHFDDFTLFSDEEFLCILDLHLPSDHLSIVAGHLYRCQLPENLFHLLFRLVKNADELRKAILAEL